MFTYCVMFEYGSIYDPQHGEYRWKANNIPSLIASHAEFFQSDEYMVYEIFIDQNKEE